MIFQMLFIHLLAVLGFRCCARAFSSLGKQGLPSSCGAWASHCGDLSSCGAQALECSGSVVAASGLSCLMACGILIARPGTEPVSHPLEGRFLKSGPPGKPLAHS